MAIRFNDDKSKDNLIKGLAPVNQEIKKFWLEYNQKTITDSLGTLDERAKFLITTCASLIVIHFGIVIGFGISEISFKITPEAFFIIAASFFSISYFPIKKKIEYQNTEFIEQAYSEWLYYKYKWHKLGFIFFIFGLISLTITTIIGDMPNEITHIELQILNKTTDNLFNSSNGFQSINGSLKIS